LAKELAECILLQHDLRASFAGLKLWFDKYAGRADLSPEGRSALNRSDWLKFKHPAAPAVKREAEEDWNQRTK
jgi:hypothetical protein